MFHRKRLFILMISCLFWVTASLNAWYFGNQPCPLLSANENSSEVSRKSAEAYSLIDELVRKAGFFSLRSRELYIALLAETELNLFSQDNLPILRMRTGDALEAIQRAEMYYRDLLARIEGYSYTPETLHKLITFDFNRLQAGRGLLKPVVNEVREVLLSGDVYLVYYELSACAKGVRTRLERLKTTLDAGYFDIYQVRQLDYAFTHFQLFGQYVSEVFMGLNR